MKALNNAIKAGLLGTVATGVIMVALPDDAKADAYALSVVEVKQLTLVGLPSFGMPPAQFFDFNATTNAELSGAGTDSGFDDADEAFSLDQGMNIDSAAANTTGTDGPHDAGGTVNPEHAFVSNGVANPGEDSYSAVGSGSVSFARSDVHMTDTMIKMMPNPTDATIGGDWEHIAEASVQNKIGTGGAGAAVQVWEFEGLVVDEDPEDPDTLGDFSIEFDLDAFLDTDVDALDVGSANASFSIVFDFQAQGTGVSQTITVAGQKVAGQGQSFSFDDSDLITEDDFDARTTFTAGGGGFTHVEIVSRLAAGEYVFTIVSNNDVVAQSVVPEPGTLGLLGAGLLGLGFLGRRRLKKDL
ncbi:MAG: EDSAP-1 family PEP-CTERM protein [Alphaproteobacteria bacterium]|jgi:hypothetical protein|nr:EDSAP-1 family PEP-CTERM protein [Alphaproteobacteria bacterium]MDP6516489.1 EDSAP-1 family PEP-CTERM protein [Alphaproteobacteria bacterium]